MLQQHFSSIPSPLPSPAAHSTHTDFSSATEDNSYPDFTDADEGRMSEVESDAAKTLEQGNVDHYGEKADDGDENTRTSRNWYPTPQIKAPPPGRYRRAAPLPPKASIDDQENRLVDQAQMEDNLDDGKGNAGLTRVSSIGSSIWAGKGVRNSQHSSQNRRPSLPAGTPHARRPAASPLGENFDDNAKLRQSVASSVYSQSQATEYEDSRSPSFAPAGHGDEAENGDEGKFDMMPSDKEQSEYGNKINIPKMPPIPPQYAQNAKLSSPTEVPTQRSRSKKGRQNRSPILSYADGVEEEERLVEREYQEHGGLQGEVTSRMGPRLKKNSPAPWEMGDMDDVESVEVAGPVRRSHEAWGMSSRPSVEQLLHPKNASTWARQSVESLRHRNASNGSQNAIAPPLPSPNGSNRSALGFPSPAAGSDQMTNDVPQDQEIQSASRRSRSKSVSSSAAGMLKGLGLASSAAPAGKKSTSKLSKAFRNMSSGNRTSSVGGPASDGRKSQGISSEDYAHLPPSPVPDERYMSAITESSTTQRSKAEGNLPSSASQATFTPVPPMMPSPVRQGESISAIPLVARAVGQTPIERLSGSNDSHTGTTISTGSSQHTAMTSPGVSPGKKPDLPDLLLKASSRYNDQAFVPSPKRNPQTGAARVPNGSSPASSSPRMVPSSPLASLPYKRGDVWNDDRSNTSSSATRTQSGAVNRSASATPTGTSQASDAPSGKEIAVSGASGSILPSERSSSKSPQTTSHDGTPMKLISLAEARQQQLKFQAPPSSGPRSSQSGKDDSCISRSVSSKSVDQSSEAAKDDGLPLQQPAKSLKNKKSGLLRMFGKDRREAGEDASLPPPLPNATDYSRSKILGESFAAEDELSDLRANSKLQSLDAPALSLRPVSSMFNGFAPGLLDSAAQQNEEKGNQLSTPILLSNGRLAPHSPAITVRSVEDGSRRGSSVGSSQHHYEDASSDGLRSGKMPDVGGANHHHQQQQQHLQAHGHRSDVASKSTTLRRSFESSRSDTSSSLGPVSSAFPPTPTSPFIGEGGLGVMVDLNSLAVSTRTKATEIEAKITELLSELVKLRAVATDNGLVANRVPPPQAVEEESSSVSASQIQPTSQPGSPLPPPSPTTATALHTVIPPCNQCGCNCADQKRQQTLNEMAVLKGLSVLDRGRALKPLANANAAKFGSYLNR